MAFSSPVSCSGTGIPTAVFSATPTTLCNSGTVVFTDQSTNTPTSWLWDFGNGQTSTVKNPSANYTAAGSYTVKLTATNASGSNSLTKTNYITVSSNCSAYLPRTGWTIKSFDSQETSGEDGAATNVLDGNTATIWHTQWAAASNPGYPHEIQIDMKSNYSVTGLAYLPRQDATTNGTIAGYQIYVSTDGTTWGSAVTSGTWANNKNEKVVNFSAKTGRYVRLVATSEVSNNIWASAAEINVIGTATSARIGFEPEASLNDNGIKVFPNPAGATFTVELSNFSPKENVTLHIYDAASGKEIIKNELGKARAAFINVSSDKAKGTIYFIKAASNTKVVTKKLIITR
jgi:PKD repeat protein